MRREPVDRDVGLMLVVDERFRTMGVNARILAEFRDAVPESAARTEVGRARSCIDALAARSPASTRSASSAG